MIEKRIMRLTWNENNWEKPSGHNWKHENQGKSNIAYENQFGYGHEEWLFNPRYIMNGFQYGYVRGVGRSKLINNIIDELYLFTKAPTSNFFLIGKFLNVEKLVDYQKSHPKLKKLVSKYRNETINELKAVNAYYQELIKHPFQPLLRYKIEDALILEEPLPLELDKSTYKRFTPYKVTPEIETILGDKLQNLPMLKFKAGKSKSRKTYSRISHNSKKEITSIHVEIIENLYKFLLKKTSKERLSAEKSTINGKIIDLIELVSESKFNLYEVKSNSSALRNIREALGQILEYALIDSKVTIKKLVIVGPAYFTRIEKEYLKNLKRIISIPIEYWYYNIENKEFILQ